MPIRPSEKARYPKDWQAIRESILDRAEGRCECAGECGLHRTTPGPRRCCEVDRTPAVWARGRIVLTVAHLDHQPENNAPSNLKAMCQRCHLRYDAKHHARNAQATRDAKRGQGTLALEAEAGEEL